MILCIGGLHSVYLIFKFCFTNFEFVSLQFILLCLALSLFSSSFPGEFNILAL
jgi:hypothetical protein